VQSVQWEGLGVEGAFDAMSEPCILCGNLRVTSIVDAAHEPAKGEPEARCTYRVYENHDLTKHGPCWKPAVLVDALFPVYWDGNRCEEHLDVKKELVYEI
jgi:hypothetical protein